jgi:PPOX class probable F420-dependent enzyme
MSVVDWPEGAFGERVSRRLREEKVIWLTTVGRDGTPQPNPVWFLWDGADSLLVYNRPDAQRLRHLAERPQLALNLDGDGQGGDIVVLTGSARRDDTVAAPDAHDGYLAKYRDDMVRVSGSVERFAEQYPVPIRVEVRRVRGY